MSTPSKKKKAKAARKLETPEQQATEADTPTLENISAEYNISADRNQFDELSRDLRSIATTDIMAVKELPSDLDQINRLRIAIDAKLLFDFVQTRLSDAERHLVNTAGELSSVYEKLDCYLFEVAQQYGARLLLSTLVMQRVWSWHCRSEKDGARKLKTLFHEIHRSALIGLKKARGRITPRHKATKPSFVRELTALQIQLREVFPETADSVRQLISDEIEASPELFPYLKTNKASLLLLLYNERAIAFRGSDVNRTRGDITPTKLYDLWVAVAENRRSPESVRQDLTKF